MLTNASFRPSVTAGAEFPVPGLQKTFVAMNGVDKPWTVL